MSTTPQAIPGRRRRGLALVVLTTLAVAVPVSAGAAGGPPPHSGSPNRPTLAVTHRLPAPGWSMAIDADLGRLYLPGGLGTAVVDTATGASLGTLPIEVARGELVIDPVSHDGFAQVATVDGPRLARLDMATGAIEAAVEIPPAGSLAVDPGRRLVVAHGENVVVVVHADTLAIVHVVDLGALWPDHDFSWPVDLEVDTATGTAWVVAYTNEQAAIDLATGQVAAGWAAADDVNDIEVDPGRTLFTTSSRGGDVVWSNLRGAPRSGSEELFLTDGGLYAGDMHLEVDAANRLLWANNSADRILAVYDLRGQRVAEIDRLVPEDAAAYPQILADPVHRAAWFLAGGQLTRVALG